MIAAGTPALRLLLCALMALGLWPLAVAAPPTSEYQIKAAYLCKFANYVEWPAAPSAGAPFVIAVVGAAAVAEEIAAVAQGLSVDGRPVLVRRVEPRDSFEGVSIVFIARSGAPHQAAVLAALQGRAVLTVTESDAGEVGSIVNFVVVGDKVRFDIALPPAQRGGLKISSRLLAVARMVTGRDS